MCDKPIHMCHSSCSWFVLRAFCCWYNRFMPKEKLSSLGHEGCAGDVLCLVKKKWWNILTAFERKRLF